MSDDEEITMMVQLFELIHTAKTEAMKLSSLQTFHDFSKKFAPSSKQVRIAQSIASDLIGKPQFQKVLHSIKMYIKKKSEKRVNNVSFRYKQFENQYVKYGKKKFNVLVTVHKNQEPQYHQFEDWSDLMKLLQERYDARLLNTKVSSNGF